MVIKQKINLSGFFLLPLAALAVILVTSLFFARSAAAVYEGATFEYRLVFSNDDKICKHMEKVYNKHFRSWDFSAYFKKRLDFANMSKDQYYRFKTRYSFWPTSPEFEAIGWQFREIASDAKQTRPVIVAQVDIDNQGKKETLMKMQFFNGGPNSFEVLHIYSHGQFDVRGRITSRDVSQGQSGKERPRIIGHPGMGIIRPFVLGGQTLLSVYSYHVPPPGDKAYPDIPPHWMWVKKYRGGGEVWPGEETPLSLDDICKFDMPRINN